MSPVAVPALEDFISGDEAAALLGVCYRTYKRYYQTGLNGVYLRTVLAGGRKRKTTRAWIQQFIAEVNAAEVTFVDPEHDEACERLRAEGILDTPETESQ